MSHTDVDCCAWNDPTVNRRAFLRAAGGTALAATIPTLFGGRIVQGAPSAQSAAETVVGQFYGTLTDSQKKVIAFPFDHELRQRISANWHVTKPLIDDDFYSKEQRHLIQEIVRNVTSPDGYERLLRQTEFDDGGLGAYSVAMFGEPGKDKFQWELTGRHLTLRADGNSVDQTAFGGPIIYGHGETEAKDNLYYYQTQQVNELFRALDPKQAEVALLSTAPKESAVAIQGPNQKYPGLAASEFSSDQKELFEKSLKTILSPYRQEDVDEVMAILKQTGGIEQLHVAFYQQGDLDQDKMWDIWRVEGPSFVWHFRGSDHVHAYINIGIKG